MLTPRVVGRGRAGEAGKEENRHNRRAKSDQLKERKDVK